MVDFLSSNRKYWHGSVASSPPKVNGERWSTPGWVLSIPLEDEQASAHLSPEGGQKGDRKGRPDAAFVAMGFGMKPTWRPFCQLLGGPRVGSCAGDAPDREHAGKQI